MTRGGTASRGKVLINRDYARLFWGSAVSTVGDFVYDTTLVLWIATKLGKDKSWAPAAVGGVMLAASVAVFLVGPLAGVFVDRWNRRRIMLRTETIRALLVGGLTALAFLPASGLPTGVWLALIYTTVFLVTSAGQFFGPARFATIAMVVPDETDRAKAAGLSQTVQAGAAMLGPPIAAPLLFTVGIQWALLLNALSYVFSYFAVRAVRTPDESGTAKGTQSAFWTEFADGLRVFKRTPTLIALLALIMISGLSTGAINTLDVFYVTENLHTRPSLYGLMAMVFGLGFVGGAALTGTVARRLAPGPIIGWSFLLAALLFLVYARQTMFLPALLLMFAIAVPVALLNVGINPLLMEAIPPEFTGRVLAVITPGAELAGILSTTISAWLASTVLLDFHTKVGGMHMGRIDTIFTGSGVVLLIAGMYALVALPRLRAAGEPGDSGVVPAAEPLCE